MRATPRTLLASIAGDLLKLVALAAGVLTSLIALGATVKPLTDGLLGAEDAATFAVLAFVPMLAYVLPFAAGFAGTMVYHRLASSNEAMAAHAGGISHRTLLLPAVLVGALLAGSLGVLNEIVIPRFLRQMQTLVTVDAARLVTQQLAQGKAFSLDDRTMIFADRADRVRPAPGSGALDQVVFSRFAAIQVDQQGAPSREITAGSATMWIFPPGSAIEQGARTQSDERDTSLVVVELQDVAAADAGAVAGFRERSQVLFRVPNAFADDPKYLTWRELAALPSHPERMNWVDARRRNLAGVLASHVALETLAQGVERAGGVATIHLRDERGLSVDVRVGGARVDGEGLSLLPDASGSLQAAYVRVGSAGDVPILASAREGRLVPITTPTGQARFTLELSDVRVRDASAPQSAPAPLREVLRLQRLALRDDPASTLHDASARQLLEAGKPWALREGAPAPLRAAYTDLDRTVRSLVNETLSKRHERLAQNAACLVITLTGAVTALRGFRRTELLAYAWTFIPGLICLVTISGGQQLIADQGVRGVWLMWSGVVALALYTLANYALLRRN